MIDIHPNIATFWEQQGYGIFEFGIELFLWPLPHRKAQPLIIKSSMRIARMIDDRIEYWWRDVAGPFTEGEMLKRIKLVAFI